MATRTAAYHCGQLRLDVKGDPFVVSICNCLACQRRTGSAFRMQAALNADQVQVAGRFSDFSRSSDEEDRKEHAFHFCSDCGVRLSNSVRRGQKTLAQSSFMLTTVQPPASASASACSAPAV